MGLNINGSWVDTKNGTVHFSTANDIDRVFFNNVKVWEKIRSLPDISITSTSQPYEVTATTDEFAFATEDEYFQAKTNIYGGSTYFWNMRVGIGMSDVVSLNINNSAYYGASAHLKVEADLGQSSTYPAGFGWCSENGMAIVNYWILDEMDAVVDNSGNVAFTTSFHNTNRYLCANTSVSAKHYGYILDPNGSLLNGAGSGLNSLDLQYCRFKLTFSFEKDGMTASGSVFLEDGTSHSDNFTVQINHTN